MLSVEKKLSSKMANMSFFCACLVVAMHVGTPVPQGSFCWYFIEFFHELLGDMAVPYFFMASGFFLAGHMEEDGWYPKEIKKRFWTLLLPYVLWSLLFTVYLTPVAILANLRAHRAWVWNLSFPGIVKTFGLNILENPLLPPFWFLRWLICLCLASPVLYWLVKTTKGWVVMIPYACAILNEMGATWLYPPPWWCLWKWVLLYPTSSFYFLIGITWRLGFFEKSPIVLKQIIPWLGLVWLAIKLFFFIATGVGLVAPDSHLASFYAYNAVFLVPCVLAWVWKCIPSEKWPSWMTGASFTIYAGHPFFTTILDRICWFSRLGLRTDTMCMLKLAIALPGCVLVSWLLKRYFPCGARLLLGKR